ncbi:MAG: ribonuclease P protein component [Treponemataceae bacterium]
MLEFRKTGKINKWERISQSNDIRRLLKTGKSFYTTGMRLFILPNNTNTNRFAVTLKRGFGNAVERNYAKRLVREAYRHIKSLLCGGYDVLLLLYPHHDDFHLRYNQVLFLFKRAKLLLS